MRQAGRHELPVPVDGTSPVTPGDLVGPYRLIEPLGRGGMGEVWLAEDPTGAAGGAPRRVALKLLDPGLVDDREARARFAREVAAARLVTGPAVAALLDADVDADRPWLASAYVAGPTLDDHVARHGPLAAGALRSLGEALADALGSIHAAGVVHRDLTPRNVVLGPDGPRVVDFGIAWYPGARSITRTGSWIGTPAWMPPERLTSDAVTAASDVWSWGAVMAYAARGRPAVGEGTPDVAAQRIAHGVADLDGVPAWLVGWVEAALAVDPADRPTVGQLRTAMVGEPSRPPVTRPDALAPPQPQPQPQPQPTETTRQTDATRATEATQRAAPPPPSRRARTVRRSAAPTRRRDATRTGRHAGGPREVSGPRRIVRWASALAVLAAAAGVGLVADLLVIAIVLTVLVVAAVVLRVARESLPEGAKPVPPTWAVGLAGPVVLGVGTVQAFGPYGAVAALVGLAVIFLLLGGDIA
jgi:serine/threonine protein kinase